MRLTLKNRLYAACKRSTAEHDARSRLIKVIVLIQILVLTDFRGFCFRFENNDNRMRFYPGTCKYSHWICTAIAGLGILMASTVPNDTVETEYSETDKIGKLAMSL